MPTSIRNELPGKITSLRRGDILSEVIIETAAGTLVSIITTRSVDELALAVGDDVGAQVKATNVSLTKCTCGGHDKK
jgi:molybdopterin-binding protein